MLKEAEFQNVPSYQNERMIGTVLSNIASVSFITDKQRKVPRSKKGLQCSESLTSTYD